jgi:hypothetical protein
VSFSIIWIVYVVVGCAYLCMCVCVCGGGVDTSPRWFGVNPVSHMGIQPLAQSPWPMVEGETLCGRLPPWPACVMHVQ